MASVKKKDVIEGKFSFKKKIRTKKRKVCSIKFGDELIVAVEIVLASSVRLEQTMLKEREHLF